MIRVDEGVHEALASRRLAEESYNDVLKRLLGMAPEVPLRVDQAIEEMGVEEMANEQLLLYLIGQIGKVLPRHWTDGPERARQVIWVVATFLRETSTDWPVQDRYNSALKSVAKRLGVSARTVRDKCVRQLYGDGPHTPRFLAALERIEKACCTA